MNQIYLWYITVVTGLVSLHTLWQIYGERQRFSKEDLNDSDSTFAWRIVLFLALPLFKLIDLRTVMVLCQNLGAYVTNWYYGLIWYQATPVGLPSQEMIIPVLFSGETTVLLLTILLLPSLFFRPHPFLAMLIGYITAFIPALYLFIEPLLSLSGISCSRWQLAFAHGAPSQLLPLVIVHICLASVYVLLLRSNWIILWFSGLTRPLSSEKLKKVLAVNECRDNPKNGCQLTILYERAGLRNKALWHLKQIKKASPDSLYTMFAEAYVAYRKRDYKLSRSSFLRASDYLNVDGELKGALLAAAGCCAFAEGKAIDALNLSERALEFDDHSLIARMVKVDVFLAQGKRQQASNELFVAMRLGLSQELEDNIPLDAEKAFRYISLFEERRAAKEAIYALSNN
jgi:hypothetical protein